VATRSIDPVLLERRLSPERLGPYRAATGGDLATAIDLYEWNARISAALWETLGHVEVLVRNAMHEHLTAWSTARYGVPRWYNDPGKVLSFEARHDVQLARHRAITGGAPETPGKVVAELNLGFWRFLTAATYDRSLWRTCLYRAFPGQGLRREVHEALRDLNRIRNRCAHHEPIHNRPIAQLHATALTVAGWVCEESSRWIAARSSVGRNLMTRP
jgi:hypothetical protein